MKKVKLDKIYSVVNQFQNKEMNDLVDYIVFANVYMRFSEVRLIAGGYFFVVRSTLKELVNAKQ